MAFLAPLFLMGLAALAVPVIIHMIRRQQQDVVEFPSLMFVRKIPYRSFRRQRIRHWTLLLLRCAALMLLIAAFARPFFRSGALAATTTGAREVVVLLDRSYSMAYGDRWDRATDAATEVIDSLSLDDRATVIFFDSGAQAGPRSSIDRASLRGLVADAEIGSGTTRYGPALKLAEGVFEDSGLPRLEAVLISDFQRVGVESATGVRFPEGTLLTPIAVGDEQRANVSVAGVLFDREYFSGRERVVVSARLTNRGNAPVEDLTVVLELDGREVEELTTRLDANGSATVAFSAVTLDEGAMVGAVRIAPDALPTDDVFWFVVTPGEVVRVLVARHPRASDEATLYVSRALGIGSSPAYDVTATRLDQLTAEDVRAHDLVILADTGLPSAGVGRALLEFVEAGGGLLMAMGERGAWSEEASDLLPGQVGRPADRPGRGAGVGFIDYSHPVFELFGTPRSGDMTTARFFRYRPVEPDDGTDVLARLEDGNPLLVEHRVGDGRVMLWASTLDTFWNDLPLKPVYLPFVHRLTQHLASYTPPTPWYTSGQVLDLTELRTALAGVSLQDAELVAVSPSGRRLPVDATDRAGFLTLDEQGVYEIRDASTTGGPRWPLAVNVDLSEADLTPVDPDELASLVTGSAAAADRELGGGPARVISPEDLERQQGFWWYLLVAAALFFVGETVVSNRLSRTVLDVD